MKFLKNIFRSSEKTQVRKYPGGKFLDVALNNALSRLGNEHIDNLYRASLLGGNVGAKLMLAHDERCSQKWGEGDETKATRLLQVWASTAVLRLLQNQEDQESVRDSTAHTFSLLFHFDVEELVAELLAYQEAIKSEMLRREESGVKNFSNTILYLRTLRALGDVGVPSFKLLPVPWGKLREMIEANPRLVEILDINILLPAEPWLLIPDALISTLKSAQEYLNQIDK